MRPRKRDRRKLGARQYRNYTDEVLSLAVDKVQNKKMSSYDTAKTYGIPRRTIERKVKKKHMNKPGSPQKLTEQEELNFVKVLIVVADYGVPLTLMDLRILVNEYLLKNNKAFIFDGKLPGEWWARAFIERHRDKLTIRSVQNIKRTRVEKALTEFQNYFKNLEHVVKNVPPTHLLNYDETNFSDNPGSVKCIFRRGVKYPERIMNSTKGCISVMFGGTADGKVLPPYVVYKSEALWSQWVEGGPDEARYNRTKSGWFDSSTFFDWFTTMIVPWARKLKGTKVIIGDNLNSHINIDVIELCEKYEIKFVLLPPNSTQLTQPLDVAFFGPLKKTWRKILTNYKVENPRQASLNKCHFPPLLKKVMDDVYMGIRENVVSGFKATGICPFNPEKVLKKVPEYTDSEPAYSVDSVLLEYLKDSRKSNEMKRGKNKKLKVESGMSISKSDFYKREATKNQAKNREKKSVTKKMKIEETDQFDTEINLESNVKIDEFTGQKSKIVVKLCGNLSDIENPDDKNTENYEDTSSEHNKKRKRNKKVLSKKEKKEPIKISRNIESGSTKNTKDLEISLHSDSDIIDIDLEEEDYFKKQFNNKSLELPIDSNEEVARTVDVIEKEIFERIAMLSKGDIELEDCDMSDSQILVLNKNASDGDEHMNKVDLNSRLKKDIYQHLHDNNNNLNNNECTWNIGDTIIARYYSSHQWKYYIGIIENVNNSQKVFSVSYYKTIQLGDNIKFVKPKREDKDSSLPENCIVKSINLLQISQNPDEYILYNDDDDVYFKI